MGPVGTIVSVSGTNFQVAAANNKAALGGITAAVQTDASSPTATLLKIGVPNGPPSGKISITTPFGKATSAADFFGLPATINAADVEFSGRLTVEGPAVNVVTTSPGKKAVLLFDGSPGQGLHLVSASGTFAAGISAVVYAPDGSVLDTLSLSNQGLLNFSRLPFGLSAGSHAIVLSPQATDKGSISLSLIADVTGTLTVDGMTPVSFSGGRSARFSFTAEAGKGYGLALTGYTISPSANLAVTLRKADGGSQSTCYVSNPSATCSFAPSLFATAGTYMIDFVPGGPSAVAFDAAFSKDTGGALTVDAPAATTMTIARAGQNGRYTFSGTAGDSMSVVLTNMQGIGGTTNVQVLRPSNGASIGSMNVSNSQGGNLNVTLPDTGIYTVLVDNLGLYTGTIDVQVKSFATGQLAVDGTTAVNLSAGRTGRYSFTAEAGKGYGLGLVGYTMTPSASLYITLRKADGTALTNCNIYSAGGGSCSFAPSLFATAGTYMIDFVPGGPSAVAFDAAFSKDTGGALTVDASAATTMTIARAGQNGRYTFSGTASQAVSVTLSNMQGISSTTNVRLYRPSDGASVGSWNFYSGQGGTLNITLPETGTYTLFIDNLGLDTGTLDVRVTSN